jgi:hypothetical protein
MLENYFRSEVVNQDTLTPNDNFGMDMNSRNFQGWRERSLRARESSEPPEVSSGKFIERLEREFQFRPLEFAGGLNKFEEAKIREFGEATVPFLLDACGHSEEQEAWQCGIEVESSDYRFSESSSVLYRDASTGFLVQARMIAAIHQMRNAEGAWVLPGLSYPEDGAVSQPETFENGPVVLMHLLRSVYGNSNGQEAIVLRFSEEAFKEAIEHFVGGQCGLKEYAGRFSHVQQLICEFISEKWQLGDFEIDSIRLVESRLQETLYHFCLELEVDGDSHVVDVGIRLNPSGVIELEAIT